MNQTNKKILRKNWFCFVRSFFWNHCLYFISLYTFRVCVPMWEFGNRCDFAPKKPKNGLIFDRNPWKSNVIIAHIIWNWILIWRQATNKQTNKQIKNCVFSRSSSLFHHSIWKSSHWKKQKSAHYEQRSRAQIAIEMSNESIYVYRRPGFFVYVSFFRCLLLHSLHSSVLWLCFFDPPNEYL